MRKYSIIKKLQFLRGWGRRGSMPLPYNTMSKEIELPYNDPMHILTYETLLHQSMDKPYKNCCSFIDENHQIANDNEEEILDDVRNVIRAIRENPEYEPKLDTIESCVHEFLRFRMIVKEEIEFEHLPKCMRRGYEHVSTESDDDSESSEQFDADHESCRLGDTYLDDFLIRNPTNDCFGNDDEGIC